MTTPPLWKSLTAQPCLRGAERGETRRKINRKGCCLQNVQINSSMFKAGLVENNKVRRQMWVRRGREGAVDRYCRSVHPSVSVCGNSRAAAGEQRGNCLVYPVQLLLIITSTHSNQNNLLHVWGLLLRHDPSMSSKHDLQACPPLDPNLLLYWKANLLAEFSLCNSFMLYSFCPDLLVYTWKQSAIHGSKHVFRFKEYRLIFQRKLSPKKKGLTV